MIDRQSLTFFVYGQPKGRIHTRPAFNRKTGRVFTRGDTSPGQVSWTVAAREAAAQAAVDQGWQKPEVGAIWLSAEFIMPRPQAYVWKGPHAEPWHWKQPDRDNLEKGLLDGLRGILFRDDAQVCQGPTSKRYAHAGEQCGALIRVAELGEWQEVLAEETPSPSREVQGALL